MRLQNKLDLRVFSIVIRQDLVKQKGLNVDVRDAAWGYLFQRLERFTTNRGKPVLVFHDEGEDAIVRSLMRKARRIGSAGSAFGTGTLKRPATLLVEDPIPRKSHESYFLQLTDIDAYAAFRKLYPPPPRPVQIVPQNMWDELGDARLAKANYLSGGPPGIVSWP
jgi:hypothetical protein